MMPRVILFLGAPGSGKGTQSRRLSSELGIACLSTGEILRSEASRSTPASSRLRQVLASGELVSDEMVCNVVAARLQREVPSEGLILDGFPRTVRQAAFLDSILTDLGLPKPTVFHLHVSETALVCRLTSRRQCASCGSVYNLLSRPSLRGSRCENDGGALVERDDDSEGIVRKRLADFEITCAPLLKYYADADMYRLDGDRDPDVIAGELAQAALRQHAEMLSVRLAHKR